MLSILKGTVITVLLLIGGFWVLSNYSAISSRYECIGTYESNDNQIIKGKLFLRIDLYRFYVHLWSNSDGSYFIEDMDGILSYGNKLRDDSTTSIFLINNDGIFSKISGNLWIKTYLGLFKGKCALTPNI